MNPDLALALKLADQADAISLSHFRRAELRVETKPDMTPVTEADRAVEQALRDHIATARPDHAVVGEEFGAAGESEWRWIIDPIDGTKNYVRGIPVYASLIALQHGDDIVVGVVSAPALGRRWWAARGEGAFADGLPILVSAVDRLEDAQLCYGSLEGWEKQGRSEAILGLVRGCWRSRGFGDFWQHMLVAEGAADVAAEPEVSLWDVAALQVIVEEAGGRLTDLDGVARPDGGSAVSTNGLLHDEVLKGLGGPGGRRRRRSAGAKRRLPPR